MSQKESLEFISMFTEGLEKNHHLIGPVFVLNISKHCRIVILLKPHRFCFLQVVTLYAPYCSISKKITCNHFVQLAAFLLFSLSNLEIRHQKHTQSEAELTHHREICKERSKEFFGNVHKIFKEILPS